MIIICHNDNKVSQIIADDSISVDSTKSIVETLFDISSRFPTELLVWCNIELLDYLNISAIEGLFRHDKMMFSYQPSGYYLGDSIGYVEESIFIKGNKTFRFPTWRMSSDVGAISAASLKEVAGEISADNNFNYFLNSLEKKAMPMGLMCYSEPALLKGNVKSRSYKNDSVVELFRFVKQHYRTRWIFLLLLNLAIYEKRLAFLPFLQSLFYRKRTIKKQNINIPINTVEAAGQQRRFDVLIPTIGRKSFLYDVLQDLRNQTLIPAKVIIVEQNPQEGSLSELDYLTSEDWPFSIDHIFTNQAGACNARNLGLEKITSEWVFFADDDIRIEPDFLANAFANMQKHDGDAASVACYQKGDNKPYKNVFQYAFFGSGCSIVRADKLNGCRFQMGYEFGFGEDADFGMQLRKNGCDILYLPQPEILHLKAPVGGFRVKPPLAWQHEEIQPKPSPTVMLFMLSHYTKQQLAGYKTNLFFKFYKHQPTRNPFAYYRQFKKQWNKSIFWANQLKQK